MPKTTIMVTHRQVGFHFWSAAPPEVEYLRHPHRHLFLLIVCLEVGHEDRHYEFHTVQNQVRNTYAEVHDFGARSCETIARELGEHLSSLGMPPEWVECWEDEENGSRVEWATS